MQGKESTVLYMSTSLSSLETMQELWHKTSGSFWKKEVRTLKGAWPKNNGLNSNQDASQPWNSPSTTLSVRRNLNSSSILCVLHPLLTIIVSGQNLLIKCDHSQKQSHLIRAYFLKIYKSLESKLSNAWKLVWIKNSQRRYWLRNWKTN